MTLNETPPDPIVAINQSFDALMQRLDDFEAHMMQRFDDLDKLLCLMMCMMGVGFAAILAMLGVIISRLP